MSLSVEAVFTSNALGVAASSVASVTLACLAIAASTKDVPHSVCMLIVPGIQLLFQKTHCEYKVMANT